MKNINNRSNNSYRSFLIAEVIVIQRSDGMFNFSDFINKWNHKENDSIQLDVLLQSDDTKDFITRMIQDGNIMPKQSDNNGDVWLHGYLFLYLSMRMSPKIEIDLLSLLSNRDIYSLTSEYRTDVDYWKN